MRKFRFDSGCKFPQALAKDGIRAFASDLLKAGIPVEDPGPGEGLLRVKFALFDAGERFDGVAASSSHVVVDGTNQCAGNPLAAPLFGDQKADDDPHAIIGEFEALVHALIAQLWDRRSRGNLEPTDRNSV